MKRNQTAATTLPFVIYFLKLEMCLHIGSDIFVKFLPN